MNRSNDRLLTPAQVAERLQVSKATVARWLRQGVLPGVVLAEGRGESRIRRMFRVREEELDAWLDERQIKRKVPR